MKDRKFSYSWQRWKNTVVALFPSLCLHLKEKEDVYSLQIDGSKNMVTRCHIRVPRSPWQQIGEMMAYSAVNIRPSFAWLIPG